ncbi:hypothetical protein RP20_CCG002061 [Aedes albopictus]|nr:hypothetical protein RP20_CCG002061 [Aedes albopictus]
MVQESKFRTMGNGSNNGSSSSMYRQPEKSSANFGSSIQKMKMTNNSGSTFGSAKSNDPGKAATNPAVWGQFKSRDQFVSMHFS